MENTVNNENSTQQSSSSNRAKVSKDGLKYYNYDKELRTALVVSKAGRITSVNPDDISDRPIGLVRLMTDIALELNRSIVEYNKAIENCNQPILLELIARRASAEGDVSILQLSRIATGKIPSCNLATIKCIKNKIKSIAINKDFVLSSEYNKYFKVGAIIKIKFPDELSKTPFSMRQYQVDEVVKAVFGVNSSKVIRTKIIEKKNVLEASVALNDRTYNKIILHYSLSNDMWIISSISVEW